MINISFITLKSQGKDLPEIHLDNRFILKNNR